MRQAHATLPRDRPRTPPPVPARLRRPSAGEIVLRACRPRQWLKNALVAIAPGAAGALGKPRALLEVLGALIVFCLLSSATYLVNDVRDRHQDQRHPRKRFRPIASGELRPRGALRLALLMAAAGLVLAVAVQPLLGLVGATYLVVTTTYSVWWRRVVLLDLVAVAAGFVLRALAGAAATGIAPSRSFLIVTSACALMIVAGKRYAELGAPRPARETLRRYSRRGLRLLVGCAALLACGAYAWWAFSPSSNASSGPSRTLSMVPFMLWLGRYRGLIRAGAGEAPEELIVRDPGLVSLGLMWAALVASGVYG